MKINQLLLPEKNKREYHYAAILYISRNEEMLRKMKMAECILFNKEINILMGVKEDTKTRVNPPQMDDKSEPHNIADLHIC